MLSSPDVVREDWREANLCSIDELRGRLARVAAGGGEAAQARSRKRGKLPVRERIDRVLDPATPFLELSPLAAEEMYDGDAPGAGIVTGIGTVEGRQAKAGLADASIVMNVKQATEVRDKSLRLTPPCAPTSSSRAPSPVAWRRGSRARRG